MHEPASEVMAVARSAGRRGVWRAWAFLLAGLLTTALAALYTKATVEATATREFDLVCREIHDAILARLSVHEQILRSGAAFFEHPGGVDRQAWHRFITTQKLESRFPGIQGMGFQLLIPPGKLAQHIQELRAEGFPDYHVRPAGEREIYSAVIYLEPLTVRNARALGYDGLSEPVRRVALERARDLGVPALSGKVTLVQETDQDVQAGTLMYVPVYRQGLARETVAQRREALLGWVYSPYRMNDLMRGIMGDLAHDQRLRLRVFDGDKLTPESLLFDSQPAAGEERRVAPGALALHQRVVSAGRTWTLQFSRTGSLASAADYGKVWLVLCTGVSTSLLLAGCFYFLLNTQFTARQMARQLTVELAQSEKKFRLLTENIKDVVWILDVETLRFRYVSPSVERLRGYTPDEILAEPITHALTAEAGESLTRLIRGRERDFLAGNMAPGQFDTNDVEQPCKDGSTVWTEAITSYYLNPENGRVEVRGVTRDISDRKRAEKIIGQERDFIQAALDILPGLFYLFDDQGRFLRVNQNFEKVSGYSTAAILQMTPLDFFGEADKGNIAAAIQRAMQTGESTVEANFLSKDQTQTPYFFTGKRFLFSQKSCIIGMGIDITALKQAEAELRQRDRDLQERNAELIRFTYTVSHDLKSPLVTIGAFLGYLEKDLQRPDPAAVAKDLGYIRNAATKMSKLLDELLMLSRVGRVLAPPVDVTLQTVVQEALALVAGRISQGGVQVEVTTTPLVLHGDQARLVEVFQNLVDNACKFMGAQPAPRIEIAVEEKAGGHVIVVRDNGIGIDPRYLAKVFGLFEKLDSASAGTGIGLALVKRIVEVHGGRIWVESGGLGKGAAFRFTLGGAAPKAMTCIPAISR